MVSSTLHLTFDKGPKQGETLAPTAGTLIRIGRVIKGNNFTIKDPAISQNHLVIEFSSEISRWTVKDLDTSNGTIVNDAQIPSSTPFPLSEGDTIKIGKTTSISVKIEGDAEVEGELRQGRKRGARSRAEILDMVVGEEKCEEVKGNLGRGRARRGNASKVPAKDEVLGVIEEENIELKPRRAGLRTRAASAKEKAHSELIGGKENLLENNVEADGTKIEKKNEVLGSVEASIEKPKKRGKGRKAPARTRASSAKAAQDIEPVQGESKGEEFGEEEEPNESNVGGDAEGGLCGLIEGKKNLMESNVEDDSRRFSKKNEILESVEEVKIEKPKNVKRGRAKKALAQTRASSARILQADEPIAEEVGREAKLKVGSMVDGEGKEVSGEEKGEKSDEETVVDFEKMTLGEWFDSMDKYLPQAINEVTEQMIASLREKAQRFEEYIANVSNDG